MANNFNLTLDTTAPANPSIAFTEDYALTPLQTVTLATSDGDTTGYQMKIWGNVDTSYDVNIQDTEIASVWVTFTTTKQIQLSTGDGLKTLSIKIRDDVWNESSIVSDTVTLNTEAPIVNINSGPTVPKVSLVSGKDSCQVVWQSDKAYSQYTVRVVPSTGADHTQGTQIPTTAGSTNTSGASGAAASPVTTTIKGADLQAAASGDGAKIIKIFVQDDVNDLWSV